MELFIFIAFQLFMEVQSFKSPTLNVSPKFVLRESSSVKMICETPAGVAVKQCFFYINSEENKKVSRSCELDLTGAEVLRWAAVKSPASVNINCFYERSDNKTSSHSPAVTLTIHALTVRATSQTTTYSKTAVSSVHTSAADHKDHPLHRETWFIVLVSTGVGVILTGFICLCRFASKKRRKHNKMRSISSDIPSQGIGMSSGPAETYSLITSVPAPSQPISEGLEHPNSHQDNTPDPTATSSFIMAENSIYQPSEVLVNAQQKEGNTVENENVYPLYCTIPDRPVQSNAADQVYSLVKMQ
ncbi:uncharacterized protein LOC125256317 [Megalobrama amblycephala]|uniref:uncharacterized protein LOC125256317 n=1 Tax=Megalobrama amblycephala TaxID=75352 RepID=UPI00201439F6|nr:uncharacterized protein LOC125256317 [Megalobrama amblycephala]